MNERTVMVGLIPEAVIVGPADQVCWVAGEGRLAMVSREDCIACAQLVPADRTASAELLLRGARDSHARLRPRPHGEARAIEAFIRVVPTPRVRHPDHRPRSRHRRIGPRPRRRRWGGRRGGRRARTRARR